MAESSTTAIFKFIILSAPTCPLVVLQVDNLLPPATAALPSLESLALVHMKHQAFPSSVAERLMSLTDLDLSGNSFGRLPAALTRISTLNTLNMSRNDDLQMEKGDSDTLAALPNLRMLLLKKADRQIKSWSAASLAELIHISTRFPNLVLTV
jgi:Leucine-rich repeat (LRR) protein